MVNPEQKLKFKNLDSLIKLVVTKMYVDCKCFQRRLLNGEKFDVPQLKYHLAAKSNGINKAGVETSVPYGHDSLTDKAYTSREVFIK